MRFRSVLSLLVAAASVSGPASIASAQDAEPKMPGPEEMAKLMEKAKAINSPGPNHKMLERFIGKWNVETRMVMGGQTGEPESGTCENTWLMDGRWLKSELRGTMMRMPYYGFMILGYDNFKQSFVFTHVSNLETAMRTAEGDMDPGGKALLMYGTLDEYLTGEHDKMVKYVWRFPSDDKIVLEVHDLPIGENNTKVIEITYTRAE